MSDACDPANQIGNYTPTSNGVDTKNADLRILVSDMSICNNFTVNGEPIFTNIADSYNVLQNQSAASSVTTFTGNVLSDGISSSGTLAFTTSALNVTSAAVIGDLFTTPLTVNIANPGTTTLSSNIFQTLAATPPSYTAQANWYVGKSATSNNCFAISFRNSGVGSASNYLALSPLFQNGFDILPTQVRANGLFQVKGNTIPAKTLASIQTFTSTTSTYSFNLNAVSGCRRIVVQIIDMVRSNTSTPVIQVGQSTTYYTNNAGCYTGVTGGNNGSAEVSWLSTTSNTTTTPVGIYLWNAAASPLGVGPATNVVIEFSYMHSDPGYQVWAVSGNISIYPSSGTNYWNTCSGVIQMNTSPNSTLSAARIYFPGGNPLSGYMTVLAF